MHFLFIVTDLKNEFLCWLTKMPRVLRWARLERPYRMAFLLGPQSRICGFRTLWMVEPIAGTCFVDSDAAVLFFCSFMSHVPLLRAQLCPFIQFNKSFCSNWISISLLLPWFSAGFSLSCVRGLSLLLHSVCTLPPVTSLQAFSHHIHYYLDGDIQERPTFALSSLLRQPLCRVT